MKKKNIFTLMFQGLKRLFSFKKAIHSKVFVSFLLVFVLPVAGAGLGSYIISLNILTQKVSSSFSETVFYVKQSVEKDLYQINQISAYIYIDLDLKDAIAYRTNDLVKSRESVDTVIEKLNNYLISSTFNYINVIKIYGFNGFEMVFGQPDKVPNIDDNAIFNSPYYVEMLHERNKTVWAGIHDSYTNVQLKEDEKSISLFRMIKDKTYKENIAAMYLDIDPELFIATSENLNLNSGNEIYILDNANQIINQNGSHIYAEEVRKLYGEKLVIGSKEPLIIEDKQENLRYFCYTMGDFDWKVVGVMPLDDVVQENEEMYLVMAIVLIISFIAAGFVWYFVLLKMVKPIKKITNATKMVRYGDFDIQVDWQSEDELGDLANNFNYMVRKIKSLLQEVLEENSRKKDAEYKALQAQINPHFLYNTLNSIRWMAIIQKSDNIKKVVDSLGRLLRNSTSKVQEFITIGEEIDNLKDYLYIQKIAYKNKFRVKWEVDKKLLSHKCLKFILQPLVENAIFHGILPKDSSGTIWLAVQRKGDSIEFSVKDNGVGISPEGIATIFSENEKEHDRFSGIGVTNVKDRIELTYKEKGAFHIKSVLGEYTLITVIIPYSGQEKGED